MFETSNYFYHAHYNNSIFVLPADRNVLRVARPITTEDHPPPVPITLMDVADMEAEEEAV
jgi:hypothetical protein